MWAKSIRTWSDRSIIEIAVKGYSSVRVGLVGWRHLADHRVILVTALWIRGLLHKLLRPDWTMSSYKVWPGQT